MSLDRQILTNDLHTLRAAFENYQRGTGPELVVRLAPGAPIVHISAIDQIDGQVRVQLQSGQGWHRVWAFYKRIEESIDEEE